MKRSRRLSILGALILPLGFIGLGEADPVNAAPAACQPSTAAPTDIYPGATVVADNFESGTLGSPWAVNTSGTGTATVSASPLLSPNTGVCSAHLHTTTDAGSIAKIEAPLPANTKDVYADGWFNIATEGVAGNNVPFFRIFSGSSRVIDIFQENITHRLTLRLTAPTGTFSYATLVPNMVVGTWHHLVMHVTANLAATTVEISFDDKSVYSINSVNIGFSTLTGVQLGSEHDQQMADIYADNVIVKASAQPTSWPPAPVPTPPGPATWPLYKMSYDATIYELVTNADGSRTPVPLSFAKWRDTYAFKNPSPASTEFVKYPWSPSVYAVTFWPGGEASWQWARLDFKQWQTAGAPFPRFAGWIKGSTYYRWATSTELFALGEDGALHKLTATEWAAAGNRAYDDRTDSGFLKLSWTPDVAKMTSIGTGQGQPITFAQWQGEAFPAPGTVQRIAGDQFYQTRGNPTIWYAGPTMNRPITFREWVAAGQPAPTIN